MFAIFIRNNYQDSLLGVLVNKIKQFFLLLIGITSFHRVAPSASAPGPKVDKKKFEELQRLAIDYKKKEKGFEFWNRLNRLVAKGRSSAYIIQEFSSYKTNLTEEKVEGFRKMNLNEKQREAMIKMEKAKTLLEEHKKTLTSSSQGAPEGVSSGGKSLGGGEEHGNKWRPWASRGLATGSVIMMLLQHLNQTAKLIKFEELQEEDPSLNIEDIVLEKGDVKKILKSHKMRLIKETLRSFLFKHGKVKGLVNWLMAALFLFNMSDTANTAKIGRAHV